MHIRQSTSIVVAAAAAAAALLTSAPARAQEAGTSGTKTPVEVTLYPILVVAPLFGASVNLPSLPSRPPGEDSGGESGTQSASTDVSLNAAYMAAIDIRSDRWYGGFRGQWAALSASRQTPRVS